MTTEEKRVHPEIALARDNFRRSIEEASERIHEIGETVISSFAIFTQLGEYVPTDFEREIIRKGVDALLDNEDFVSQVARRYQCKSALRGLRVEPPKNAPISKASFTMPANSNEGRK